MNNVLTLKNVLNSCTGCGACAIVCPQKCIVMEIDIYGFFSPVIDEQSCIDCGKCTQVCYKLFDINNLKEGKQLEDCKIYAATYSNQLELKTVASGGVASELARYYFNREYNVLGVVFDPENDFAEHILATNENDLENMKGSKYIQSYLVNAFSNIQTNHRTLIIGLPCQIYGIRKYIQQAGVEKDYILVDMFCRGTTTINLYRRYRDYLKTQLGLGNLLNLNFRSKRHGWHKFSMVAEDESKKEYEKVVYEDLFYSFYLKNTCFKESCYNCEFRHNRVFSDIRIGDFWGEKYYARDEGVSIVSIYSTRGQEAWENIKSKFIVEENLVNEIKKSQRFNKFPMPEYRYELLNALCSEESLTNIHKYFGIDQMGFYSENKK